MHFHRSRRPGMAQGQSAFASGMDRIVPGKGETRNSIVEAGDGGGCVMMVDNVDDLINILESFDGWQSLSLGNRNGRECLFIHSGHDFSVISGCVFIPGNQIP